MSEYDTDRAWLAGVLIACAIIAIPALISRGCASQRAETLAPFVRTIEVVPDPAVPGEPQDWTLVYRDRVDAILNQCDPAWGQPRSNEDIEREILAHLVAVYAQGVAAERERCAQMVVELGVMDKYGHATLTGDEIAAAIRGEGAAPPVAPTLCKRYVLATSIGMLTSDDQIHWEKV